MTNLINYSTIRPNQLSRSNNSIPTAPYLAPTASTDDSKLKKLRKNTQFRSIYYICWDQV